MLSVDDFFAHLKNKIQWWKEQSDALKVFHSEVKEGLRTCVFDLEDLKEVEKSQLRADACLQCWRDAFDSRSQLYEQKIRRYADIKEDRYRQLDVADSQSRVLSKDPNLMNYFVEKQRTMEKIVHQHEQQLVDWDSVLDEVEERVEKALK